MKAVNARLNIQSTDADRGGHKPACKYWFKSTYFLLQTPLIGVYPRVGVEGNQEVRNES